MLVPFDYQDLATIIAIPNLLCHIGSAVGSTISTATWAATFRNNFIKHIPEGVNVRNIYVSLPNPALAQAKLF